MARLLEKQNASELREFGRLSDGSDAQTVLVPVWWARVLDDDGKEYVLTFDHDPSTAEIYAAIPKPPDLTPVAKADWDTSAARKYTTWKRWHDTHSEATARNEPAALRTALLTRRDAAWTDYLAALNSWRTAT